MDETPSDSGELPDSAEDAVIHEDETGSAPAPMMAPVAPSRTIEPGEQLRRPAVWGLLVLIAVVLALQVWLLYL